MPDSVQGHVPDMPFPPPSMLAFVRIAEQPAVQRRQIGWLRPLDGPTPDARPPPRIEFCSFLI